MSAWLAKLIADILAHLATTFATAAIKRVELAKDTADHDRATDERLERFNKAFKESQNDPEKLKSAISDFIRGGM